MIKDLLTERDIEQIKTHSYKTTGYSWLDNKLNPFWEKCSDNLPYALSPNMVTLIGMLAQLTGIFIIMIWDPTLSIELSKCTNYYYIFIIFVGQTMDAIDGKHARKTKRTSPLGQLMDHGCDAFSNSFITIMACQSLGYSYSIGTVLTQILVQVSI
jgi:ethanolaminephosphotransferase